MTYDMHLQVELLGCTAKHHFYASLVDPERVSIFFETQWLPEPLLFQLLMHFVTTDVLLRPSPGLPFLRFTSYFCIPCFRG
jgi:hypothetical protein